MKMNALVARIVQSKDCSRREPPRDDSDAEFVECSMGFSFEAQCLVIAQYEKDQTRRHGNVVWRSSGWVQEKMRFPTQAISGPIVIAMGIRRRRLDIKASAAGATCLAS
jgi:hypothetical protein